MKITKKDIDKFRNEVCPNCQKCQMELTDNHILACPRTFNWMLGYENGIITLENYKCKNQFI